PNSAPYPAPPATRPLPSKLTMTNPPSPKNSSAPPPPPPKKTRYTRNCDSPPFAAKNKNTSSRMCLRISMMRAT
ncbi:hypothetical protein IscW_ISCW017606, partial [Ixodes scapularis]